MILRRRYRKRGDNLYTYLNPDAPDHPRCLDHCATSAYKIDGVKFPEILK
jgi:hypothetical protein